MSFVPNQKPMFWLRPNESKKYIRGTTVIAPKYQKSMWYIITRINLGTLNFVENSLISKTLETTLALILRRIALTLCPGSNLVRSRGVRGLALIKFAYVIPVVDPSPPITLSELLSKNYDEGLFCEEVDPSLPSVDILTLVMRCRMLAPPSYLPPA